jgi:uncharacterized membrane protein YbaN (DUF454 family)
MMQFIIMQHGVLARREVRLYQMLHKEQIFIMKLDTLKKFHQHQDAARSLLPLLTISSLRGIKMERK